MTDQQTGDDDEKRLHVSVSPTPDNCKPSESNDESGIQCAWVQLRATCQQPFSLSAFQLALCNYRRINPDWSISEVKRELSVNLSPKSAAAALPTEHYYERALLVVNAGKAAEVALKQVTEWNALLSSPAT